MNKRKSDGMYFFWSVAMLLSVVLAVFVLMFASCSGTGDPEAEPSDELSSRDVSPAPEDPNTDAPAEPSDGVPPTSDVQQPPVADPELGPTEDMGQEYIDKIYFLGDSTTHGLAYYGLIPEERVWTPQNGTLSIFRWNVDQIYLTDEGTTMFMTDALAAKKPEYLLVTLGVNGVGALGQEDFIRYYSEMVDALKAASPETKIILNSIYPVGRGYAEPSINNEGIDAANSWIKGIAGEKGVRYLNSASSIKDEEGYLPEGADNGDKLHPNAETYGTILNYIRTHGYV